MAPRPVIQILSKRDYNDQYLAELPDALPLPPLPASSIRVRTSVFALTVNNITYAKIGHLLGWWDVHPLPSSTPPGLQDKEKYGRISCWGYGVVEESTYEGLPVGSMVYGYLPIGTLPVDLTIEPSDKVPGQLREVSVYRSHLLPIYNLYTPYSPEKAARMSESRLGWNSLLKVMFKTGYLINRFVFAWEQTKVVAPNDGLGGAPRPSWTADDANIKDAVVIMMAASGKAALSLAHQLKKARPADSRPRKVVAVTSPTSKAFVEATGFYDLVCTYEGVSPTSVYPAVREFLDAETKVILCDFGSRGAHFKSWFTAIMPLVKDVKSLAIGSEPKVATPEVLEQGMADAAEMGTVRVNASDIWIGAIMASGGQEYSADMDDSFDEFMDDGGIPGMKLVFANGMDAVGKAWGRLCAGDVRPDEGLAFKL